jgi:copper chaperone
LQRQHLSIIDSKRESICCFYHQKDSSRTRKSGEGMAEFTLKIEGMHCGSCVRRVSQALAATDGMVVKEVRVGAARVSSAHDPAPVDVAIAALAKAGYAAYQDQ